MGNWFAGFLKSNNYKVLVCDRNKQAALICSRRLSVEFVNNCLTAARRADIIVLAIPTKETNSMLMRLEGKIRKGTCIVEISSVKAPVQRTIRSLQKNGVPVLSIHPMFGSGTKTIRGRSILVVSRPHHREAERFLSILRRKGARVISCSAGRQDTLTSTLIALPHLMNISLIETLRRLGLSLNELNTISGTTFKLQSLIAEAIYHEDTGNEISILVNSKESVLRAYKQEVEGILSAVRTRPERLSTILSAGRRLVEADRRYSDSYERFNAAVQAALI